MPDPFSNFCYCFLEVKHLCFYLRDSLIYFIVRQWAKNLQTLRTLIFLFLSRTLSFNVFSYIGSSYFLATFSYFSTQARHLLKLFPRFHILFALYPLIRSNLPLVLSKFCYPSSLLTA